MNSWPSRLLGVCLAVAVVLGGIAAVRAIDDPCGPLARGACLRVLFLGNSYTFVNDLPSVLRDLGRASGHGFSTTTVAAGGETLAAHAGSSASLDAIAGSRWDVVVLQEQSQIPSVQSLREAEMYPAVRSLVEAIMARGATPILLETWAHRDGWSDRGLDYRAMQAAIDEGYRRLGIDLGVAVAPAGEAWQTGLRLDPPIQLWQDDGSHPSTAGTYLAACVVYATILHESPVGNPSVAGLSSDAAGALQAVAAATTGLP